MSRPALVTDRLSKRFGSKTALRECTLSVPAGRICALVGPNGAGKTTLLQLATGLLRPTSGSIEVLGATPSQDGRWLARVGYLAQDVPLYRRLTAEQLLGMGAHLNPGWDDSLAHGRLAALGFPLDRPVGRLSGGERAQVALALALGKRPQLLLLDEPVASLDPLARFEFLSSLAEATADAGLTVVLSSHLTIDIERICDYLVLLHSSRVQLTGDIADLLAEHKLLTGPRRSAAGVAASHEIISERHSERQTRLLVRGRGPIHDPAWQVADLSLDELILAYMARDRAGSAPAGQRVRALRGVS